MYIRYKMKDVVKITNTEGAGGTGWVTSSTQSGKTVVITNAHVCELQENGKVFVEYRDDVFLLPVLTVYKKNDLCAITAPNFISGGLDIANGVTEGERVYTTGHPLLEPRTTSAGEYSGKVVIPITRLNIKKEQCSGEGFRFIGPSELPEIARIFGIESVCIRFIKAQSSTIIILPGNSGSPDLNIWGNVVGVAFATQETRSYHVPLEDLKDFLGSL